MNKGIWSALGQYQRHSCSLMDLGPGMSSTGYAAKTLRYTAGLQCNCRHGLMVVDGWCCALTEKWMWNTLRSQHRKGGTSLQKNFWALKLFPRTERTSPSANCAFEITCFFFRMHIQASCSFFQLISMNFWDTIETYRNCKRTWGACPMLLCFNMTMTSALLPDLPDGSSAFGYERGVPHQSVRRPGKPGFSWTASPVIRWRRQVSENNWRTEPSPWPSAQNGELLGDLLED